uniref:Succinate dehydrogenase [ubiquinone] cytochrome b small subunit n=1 Tax=Romanomermis culicivorax TaxID=13658 RepID=A0A915KR40_ROMCU
MLTHLVKKIPNSALRFGRLPILIPKMPNNNWKPVQYATASACPATEGKPHDHSFHFKIERLFATGMVPLFPASLFIHNPLMDYALAVAISLHCYWGFDAVSSDYAKPLGFKEESVKFIRLGVFLVSLSMFVGLLRFNYNDVGITKAFEMIWAL